MSYKEKPLIKIFKYENNSFKLQAIIDDYESVSFQHSKYEAGQFTIEINFNIPNSQKFEEKTFIQFGNEKRDFGIITNISDSIGPDGKGSQTRTITGYDARYLFKQRIIRNLNFADSWTYTGNGEKVMRELISSQCGDEAEEKRKLPIKNIIPENCIGSEYTVSEAYSNLYDVLVTVATQTEIGWQVSFVNNEMILEFYPGIDRHKTIRFDTDYNSLSDGSYECSTESYANTVYVGGQGSGENKDVYEGELQDSEGNVPTGLNRFECWDDSSSLENVDEYDNEARSKLNEYSQTVSLSGNGLAKCPYEFRKQYDVGDIITVSFSGKKAVVQIVSITEHWTWGAYDISFEFGKPVQDLSRQLNLLLSQIRTWQNTENNKKSNVKYYNIPEETHQPNQDVILDVIGFIGDVGDGHTFRLYFDFESKTGAKTYHVYFKNLSGSGKLTLTTGVDGTTGLEFGGGTYVAIIYVDAEGNVKSQGALNDVSVSSSSSWSSEKTKNEIDNVSEEVEKVSSDKNDKITTVDYTDDSQHPITDSTGIANFSDVDSDGKNPKKSYIRTWLQAWTYIRNKIRDNNLLLKNSIQFVGTKATHTMIKFLDNTTDTNGDGIVIGGGGATVIGGGESANTWSSDTSKVASASSEIMDVVNDGVVRIATNIQSGVANAKISTFDRDGNLTVPEKVIAKTFEGNASQLNTSYWKYKNITKDDNGGYDTVVLISDVTDWFSASSGASHYGFTGYVIQTRSSGYMNEYPFQIVCRCGYKGATTNTGNTLNLSSSRLASCRPQLIKYTNPNDSLDIKYYLGLRLKGSGHPFSFMGFWTNPLQSFIQLNCKKSSGSPLPDGYTLICDAQDFPKTNFSYSTDEQATGESWIDGKPIYSKTIPIVIPETSANGTAVSTNIDLNFEIDSLVKIEGYVKNDGGTSYALPVIYGTNYHYYGRVVISGGNKLMVWNNYTSLNGMYGYAIIYYTKQEETQTLSLDDEE